MNEQNKKYSPECSTVCADQFGLFSEAVVVQNLFHLCVLPTGDTYLKGRLPLLHLFFCSLMTRLLPYFSH